MEDVTRTPGKKICKCIYVMNKSVHQENCNQYEENGSTTTDKQDKTAYNNSRKSVSCTCGSSNQVTQIEICTRPTCPKLNSTDTSNNNTTFNITQQDLAELEFYRWWTTQLAEKQGESKQRFTSCSCPKMNTGTETNRNQEKGETKMRQKEEPKKQEKYQGNTEKSSNTNTDPQIKEAKQDSAKKGRPRQRNTAERDKNLKILRRLYDTPCSSISVLCSCKPPPNIADYIAEGVKNNADFNIQASVCKCKQEEESQREKPKWDAKTYCSCSSCSCTCSCCGEESNSSESSSESGSSGESGCCCCRGNNNNCCCCCFCLPACSPKVKSKKKVHKQKEKVQKSKKILCRAHCCATAAQTVNCECKDGQTQTANVTRHRTAGCQCCCKEKEKRKKKKKDKSKEKGKGCNKKPCCMRLMMCPCSCNCNCKGDHKAAKEKAKSNGKYSSSSNDKDSLDEKPAKKKTNSTKKDRNKTFTTNTCLVSNFNPFSSAYKTCSSFKSPISGRIVNFNQPRTSPAIKSNFINQRPYEHLEPLDPNDFSFLAASKTSFNRNPNDDEHKFLLTAVCGAIMSNRNIRNRNINALLGDSFRSASHMYERNGLPNTDEERRKLLPDYCRSQDNKTLLTFEDDTNDNIAVNDDSQMIFKQCKQDRKSRRKCNFISKNYVNDNIGNVNVNISSTSILIEEANSVETISSRTDAYTYRRNKKPAKNIKWEDCGRCASYSNLILNPVPTKSMHCLAKSFSPSRNQQIQLDSQMRQMEGKRRDVTHMLHKTYSKSDNELVRSRRKFCSSNNKQVEKCMKNNCVVPKSTMIHPSDYELFERLRNKYNTGINVKQTKISPRNKSNLPLLRNNNNLPAMDYLNAYKNSNILQEMQIDDHNFVESCSNVDYHCFKEESLVRDPMMNKANQMMEQTCSAVKSMSYENRMRYDSAGISSNPSLLLDSDSDNNDT